MENYFLNKLFKKCVFMVYQILSIWTSYVELRKNLKKSLKIEINLKHNLFFKTEDWICSLLNKYIFIKTDIFRNKWANLIEYLYTNFEHFKITIVI